MRRSKWPLVDRRGRRVSVNMPSVEILGHTYDRERQGNETLCQNGYQVICNVRF